MPAPTPRIMPVGDRAVVLAFGDGVDPATSACVLDAWRRLASAGIPGITDLVPAYATLTVHYDWQRLPEAARTAPWQWLSDALADALAGTAASTARSDRLVELPVRYGGADGPDLEAVAQECGMDAEELVRRHSGGEYTVAFIGFRPGFAYLLGLDPALSAPRHATPRSRVPAGSVGIAGAQTGVYPVAGPGGWRIVGRTSAPLFDRDNDPPTLLAPGDRVRFVSVDELPRRAEEADAYMRSNDAYDGDRFIEVLAPGIHTSIQDAGRSGWRHLGINAGGASDGIAATLANALVGNPADAPVLEMTLRGPDLMFHAPATLAVAGDGMDACVDADPIPFGRPVSVSAGARLSFRATGQGARAWLAVAGGLAAPRWLGSASAEFGSGLFGRSLQAGDRLGILPSSTVAPDTADRSWHTAAWWIDARAEIDSPMILRFVPDAEADSALLHRLAGQVWRASTAADRRGVRLEGPPLDSAAGAGRRVSAGVLHGTVQLPPDGLPIVLGPDCQTTGGYPVVGHVIEADLPRLAQLKPGDFAWLQPVSLAEAHSARATQAALLARLRIAISAKLRA